MNSSFVGCGSGGTLQPPDLQPPDREASRFSTAAHATVAAIVVKDRFGRTVLQKRYMPPASRGRVESELKRSNLATSDAAGDSSDTVDLCFEGAGIDPTACGVQGGSVSITWTLAPQPPSGTVVSYADTGLPSGVVDQDIFDPPIQAQQPYSTTEQIRLDGNAPVRSDYLLAFNPSCSNGAACGGGTVGISVLCSLSAEHCPTLEILDASRVPPVAAPSPVGTPLTVVGKLQQLTTDVGPGTGSGAYGLSGYNWSIAGLDASPPSAVKGFAFADGSASVQQLQADDLMGPDLSYYWTLGSGPLALLNHVPSHQVDGLAVEFTSAVISAATATRSDNQEVADLSAEALYNVDAPNISAVNSLSANRVQYGHYGLVVQTGSGTMPVHAGFHDALSLGTALAYPVTSGATSALTGTAPLSSGGQVAMSQLVRYSQTVIPIAGQVPMPASTSSAGQFVADGCALYTTNPDGSAGTSRSLEVSAGAPIAFTTVDSPFIIPNAYYDQTVADSETYADYFLFRPDGANTIWVPIANLSWAWAGQINLGSNGYTLTSSTNPTSPNLGISNNTFPVWSGVRQSSIPCHATTGS